MRAHRGIVHNIFTIDKTSCMRSSVGTATCIFTCLLITHFANIFLPAITAATTLYYSIFYCVARLYIFKVSYSHILFRFYINMVAYMGVVQK